MSYWITSTNPALAHSAQAEPEAAPADEPAALVDVGPPTTQTVTVSLAWLLMKLAHRPIQYIIIETQP